MIASYIVSRAPKRGLYGRLWPHSALAALQHYSIGVAQSIDNFCATRFRGRALPAPLARAVFAVSALPGHDLCRRHHRPTHRRRQKPIPAARLNPRAAPPSPPCKSIARRRPALHPPPFSNPALAIADRRLTAGQRRGRRRRCYPVTGPPVIGLRDSHPAAVAAADR
jgi:hypothetical protein